MRKQLAVLLVVSLAGACTESAPTDVWRPDLPTQAAPMQMVDVCHVDGQGRYRLINVNGNALPAHLAHGDAQPGDVVPGDPPQRFAADCTLEDVTLSAELGGITNPTGNPSVRYRSFGNTGGDEIYLGVHDLGVAGNRTAAQFSWTKPGTYDVEMTLASGVLSTSVSDGTSTTLTYGSTIGGPAAPCTAWDALEVVVLNRDVGTTVNLNGLTVDGIPVDQDFVGGSSFATGTWTVTYAFGSDFTVRGQIELAGTFSTSQELSKVQLVVGCN